MEAGISNAERKTIEAALDTDPKLARLLYLMVEAAQAGKSPEALATASAILPEPKLSIAEMKDVLREADCLYDNEQIWKQLGAKDVPTIPEAVIKEAYEKGGRVVLKCSSVSEKADALRAAGRDVYFGGTAEQHHYAENVSKPEWIVVQSHIDSKTLGSPKRDVVTTDKPAPTPEDWFAAIAYAKLDDGRQPKGCENRWAFTTESGTVVGSDDVFINVHRYDYYAHYGYRILGAVRFGPPPELK